MSIIDGWEVVWHAIGSMQAVRMIIIEPLLSYTRSKHLNGKIFNYGLEKAENLLSNLHPKFAFYRKRQYIIINKTMNTLQYRP